MAVDGHGSGCRRLHDHLPSGRRRPIDLNAWQPCHTLDVKAVLVTIRFPSVQRCPLSPSADHHAKNVARTRYCAHHNMVQAPTQRKTQAAIPPTSGSQAFHPRLASCAVTGSKGVTPKEVGALTHR